ncbi:hypothetical protein ACFWBI_30725 [Streptomyces sp. NPDC059982]|uniref:hypothetical protein n=1 Tax=unclassified Streptomyces TaxID=2593676 RepID=UPI0036806591
MEYIGQPKNVVKDNCNPIYHVGNCTVTADITYKSHVDVYMCMVSWETYATTTGNCPVAETVYLKSEVSEATTKRLSVTLTMLEFNSGIDPVDILLGDFIGCAKLITPGLSGGTWGDCAWAASWFVAGAIFKSAKIAVTAADAALKTGVGFMGAYMALRNIGLTEAVVQGIISRLVRKLDAACTAEDAASFKAVSLSVAKSGSDDVVKKCAKILADLVKDGDHIVLGINPFSDDLAGAVGGRTSTTRCTASSCPRAWGWGSVPFGRWEWSGRWPAPT